ncbi:MAG TPA: helical backbone metal receptor [Actinomycetota bacterium]|nr:helical backbone metal receptor [Actinomycetota bacterium]
MVHRLLGGLAALLLFLASCGEPTGSGPTPTGAPAAEVEYPVTITDDDGVRVTIEAEPQRIVTFAPSMTEIVFALGLGDRLVGVSGPFDDFPPEATGIEEVGGAGDFGVDPNVEKVVSLQPDLFLTIPGGDQWKQRLRDLGVPVVTLHADDLEDLVGDVERIGELAGVPEEGAAVAADIDAAIEDAVGSADQVSCFFEVYYPPLTTVGPGTFIFDVLETAGCLPVTDDATSDYPEWSIEELIADDPVIYVATPESAKSERAIATRPGFGQLSAIREGHVLLIDGDLITRAGPRVVEGLRRLTGYVSSFAGR